MAYDKHDRYLRFLANVAKDQSPVSRCRISAMLVYKNIPVAIGSNKIKSHPMQAKYAMTDHHIFLHAEIDVINKALKELEPRELKKCTLYVCRILANGKQAIARPCPGCQRAIKEFEIKNVYWTDNGSGYSTFEDNYACENFEDYYERKMLNKHKQINNEQNIKQYNYSCSH